MKPDLQPAYTEIITGPNTEQARPNTIIDPWSNTITPVDRAQIHQHLLRTAYGGGHPGSQEPLENLQRRQEGGELLTWIVYSEGHPVGMANCEVLSNGVIETLRCVALPPESLLPDGSKYNGLGKVSGAMYQHIGDVLRQPQHQHQVWAVEGDIRMAAPVPLPDGSHIGSGVRTQHIYRKMGVNPLLICVPRYQVHPTASHPHQEVFLQSRLYLNEQSVRRSEPLYLAHSQCDGVSLKDIALVTYRNNWDCTPEIITTNGHQAAESSLSLEQTAGIHYSTIRVTGDIGSDSLYQAIQCGLDQSRFVEIIVPNRQENIYLHHQLEELGVMPLGTMPGVSGSNSQQTTETTHHYGIVQPAIAAQMVEIELATDYQGTRMEELAHQLRNQWRKYAA